MATPNETSDRVTRMQQARDFLEEHPEESLQLHLGSLRLLEAL
jgi:hypothetical protein